MNNNLKINSDQKINYKVLESVDGTILIKFKEGYSTVVIPTINNKTAVCVSSQIGCPLGCTFCHTKHFKRNLLAEEIINQVKIALTVVLDNHNSKTNFSSDINQINFPNSAPDRSLTSVIFMGMGEPMLNFEEVNKAINIFNKDFNLAFKKITLSTIGLNLDKLISAKFNIAISLHSPLDETRTKLIPKSNLSVEQIVNFTKQFSNKKSGVMISYALIKNINDSKNDLLNLLSLDWPKNINFNLLEFNETNKFKPSSKREIEFFKKEIIKAGFKCFIRQSRGKDIGAACGMLTLI
ncbi:radical SAM protein [Candidatus Woesearchaeota archaeon]|jgi:23S rRNA (adenine2503-C2)-methyltransferase|nr:radical SAM protein [Candidatus Woesearchaeota archaeon]